MASGASLIMKNIGKPCTGKPYARFDEGALKKQRTLEYVVAACSETSIKDPKKPAESVLYSTQHLTKNESITSCLYSSSKKKIIALKMLCYGHGIKNKPRIGEAS